jgi:hypothetical protein
MTDDKARENRLRRMAARQGLKLRRSARRDPLAADYGLYWLSDAKTDRVKSPKAGISLDEIERYLTEPR